MNPKCELPDDISPDTSAAAEADQIERCNLSEDQLQKIIRDHEKWIVTRGEVGPKEGRRANFNLVDLKGLDLSNLDLRKAKFELANLEQVRFYNTDLRESIFAGASLRHANLQNASLLGPELAGADITGANLPDNITEFKPLQDVEEISKNARKTFLALILACVYSWLTIATTKDARLVSNSTSSPLPIIGAEIPIVSFYVAAPLVLLGIYVYFHFYLQHLWKALALLPARFQDGRPLDDQSYPWLVTAIIRRHHKFLMQRRSLMAKLEEIGAITLAWYTVPFTLIGFWLRYLPRHDWLVTGLHIGFLTFAFSMALLFYRCAERTIKGKEAKYIELKTIWRNAKVLNIVGVLLIGFIFWSISFGAINGTPAREWKRNGDAYAFVPWIFDKLGYDIFADFRETSVSTKPGDYWQISSESDRIRSVQGAHLKRSDLRFADMFRAFLVKANIRNSDLHGARMRETNLQHAVLRGANLENVDFRNADLRGTDFREATLVKARFSGADLRNTDLGLADFREANFENANLEGADFRCANIIDVKNLTIEHLIRVESLYRAKMNSGFVERVKARKPELFEKPPPWHDMSTPYNEDKKDTCE